MPKGDKPVTYGWRFSTVVTLPETPSSWTYVLDQQRVSTQTTPAQVAFAPLQQMDQLLPDNSIAVLDRGYNSAWLWCQYSTLQLKGALIRLKGIRCLYRPAPPPTGKPGAPHKDGGKLQPDDSSTHGYPCGSWEGQGKKALPLQIAWWQHLHRKVARSLEMTVIRVVRPWATECERDPRVSWFVWIGDQQTTIPPIALGYALRFSQEHGYRFDKQALLWSEPRLRTPEQFERWIHIVAVAHNYLVLAHDLVEASLRPRENKQRAPTPQQVRRAIRTLLPQLGTPDRPPQPRGKSPGRVKGTKIGKAKRFAVVRKAPKLPKVTPI